MQGPLDLEEICAAPNISEVVPLTRSGLELFIAQHPDRTDATFALANILLQSGEYESAASLYLRALESGEHSAALHCNLGVLFRLQGTLPDAASHLRRALEISPDLAAAHYHLAQVLLADGSAAAAKTKLEQLVRLKPNHAPSRVLLGELLLSDGAEQDAVAQFLAALQFEPEFLPAHLRLGEVGFAEGKRIYEQGRFHDALRHWREVFRKHPAALRSSAIVVREFERIFRNYRDEAAAEKSLNAFSLAIRETPPDLHDYYELFCVFLFSVGLLPEMYVAKDETEEDFSYWLGQLQDNNEYPYARFRLSLAHCYRGSLDSAFDELTAVRDALPDTKRASLRLTECIAFVQKLRRIVRDGAGTAVTASGDDWEAHGILGDLQRRAWEKTGAAPAEAGKWKALEFAPEEASLWRRHNFAPDDAAAWRTGGFSDPRQAARWLKGGFLPGEAQRWNAALEQPVETIIQCRAVGFRSPEEAREWLRVFMFPSEAIQWRDAGLTPADAVIAMGDGIHDAFAAAALKKEKVASGGSESE